MLNLEEIRSLIVARLLHQNESCSSHYSSVVQAQVRALVAVVTGEPPPIGDFVQPYLRAVDIPFTELANGDVDLPKEWLEAHGFVDVDRKPYHPRFSKTW